VHEQRKPELISDQGNKKDKRYYTTLTTEFAKISVNLPANLPFQFKLFVTNEDHADAFADPGGYIYVSRAALDFGKGKKVQAENEQKLLFMLAHEISHVLKRHETRALQAKVIDSITTIEDMKNLVAHKQANPLSAILVADMVGHRFAKYTVDQEMQADTCGIRVLTGIKGLGAKAPFHAYTDWLSVQNEGYVTSHPSSPDRIHHGDMMIAHFETADAHPDKMQGAVAASAASLGAKPSP
jgi:predicted Zn-dependent protease